MAAAAVVGERDDSLAGLTMQTIGRDCSRAWHALNPHVVRKSSAEFGVFNRTPDRLAVDPSVARLVRYVKAGELGFEPRLTDPESVVLPLHYSPMSRAVGRVQRCSTYSL